MTITVDPGVLNSPANKAYFLNADHRIRCGLRATLEALDIPLPDWAERRPPGPKPGRAILAAYRADNPESLHEATMRRSREAALRIGKTA